MQLEKALESGLLELEDELDIYDPDLRLKIQDQGNNYYGRAIADRDYEGDIDQD
jgi:hypothetical protein